LESKNLALKRKDPAKEESQSLNAANTQERESEKKNSLWYFILKAFEDISHKKKVKIQLLRKLEKR